MAPERDRPVDVVEELGVLERAGLLVEGEEWGRNPRQAPLPRRGRSSDGVGGREIGEDGVDRRLRQLDVRGCSIGHGQTKEGFPFLFFILFFLSENLENATFHTQVRIYVIKVSCKNKSKLNVCFK